MKTLLSFAALVTVLAVLPAAHAGDGVIEINHASIMADGGYPYSINTPGSYRLTSNLSPANADTMALNIGARNVTLDLNGFRIAGTNTCTWSDGAPPTVTCAITGGSGYGIYATQPNTTVRNGTVAGFGNSGIRLAENGLVEDVMVSNNGRWGVVVTSGTVLRVTAVHNGWVGIFTADGAVAESVARQNGSVGINVESAVVRHNHASDNTSHGLQVRNGSVVGNTATSNGGAGLMAWSNVSYAANAIYSNDGTALQTDGTTVLVNGGGNLCDNAACP